MHNALIRLAREYISKVNYCDECFCETYCIIQGVKKSRHPEVGCEYNVIDYLSTLMSEDACMTVDEIIQEHGEVMMLMDMIDELIDLIESADKVEDIYTDRFYEIKKYVS